MLLPGDFAEHAKARTSGAARLREFREFKKQVAFYRGLGHGRDGKKKGTDEIRKVLHVHAGVDFSKASVDQLIEAKRAILRLAASVNARPDEPRGA